MRLVYEMVGLFDREWKWVAAVEPVTGEGARPGYGGKADTPLGALTILAGNLSKALGDPRSVELMADLRATEDFRLEGIHPPWAAVAADYEAGGQDPEHAMYALCLRLVGVLDSDTRLRPVEDS